MGSRYYQGMLLSWNYNKLFHVLFNPYLTVNNHGPSALTRIVFTTEKLNFPLPLGVRALCDKYNVLWIADEVQTGLARTGK